jgi:hypothetical protein
MTVVHIPRVKVTIVPLLVASFLLAVDSDALARFEEFLARLPAPAISGSCTDGYRPKERSVTEEVSQVPAPAVIECTGHFLAVLVVDPFLVSVVLALALHLRV